MPWQSVSNKCLTLPFPSFSGVAAGLLRFALALLAETVGFSKPDVAAITVFLRHVSLCLEPLTLDGASWGWSFGCCPLRPRRMGRCTLSHASFGSLLHIQQDLLRPVTGYHESDLQFYADHTLCLDSASPRLLQLLRSQMHLQPSLHLWQYHEGQLTRSQPCC